MIPDLSKWIRSSGLPASRTDRVSLPAVLYVSAVLLLFVFPLHLGATTFYVNCANGSDRADGHSLRSAWQHLQMINDYAHQRGFHPGDSILLKRGCRWREQMELSSTNQSGSWLNSGNDRQPITITAYGTGDFPTIDGADVVSEWKGVASGTYVTSISGPVYKVFIDGDARETEALQPQPNFLGQWKANTPYHMWDYVTQPGRTFAAMRDVAPGNRIEPEDWYRVADLTPEQRTTGIDNVEKKPGSWFSDTEHKLLYVHLANDDDPSRHAVQVTRRRYGIRLQDLSHIVIEQLRIVHAAKSGILASTSAADQGGSGTANEYNTIQDCIFWNNGDVSVDVLPGTGVRGEGAIYVAASSRSADPPLKGWVIQRNAIGAIDSEKNASYDRNGITAAGTEGLMLRNNYVATRNAIGVSVLTDHGPRCLQPVIQGNYFTDSQGNLRVSGCTNPLVDSNTMEYSYGYGIQTGGNTTGAVVTHNLIHDLTATPNGHLYNGFDCNGGAPGGTLAFNTIKAVWAAEATLEVGCDHWSVHNNVFDSSNNMQHGGLTLYIRREALPGMKFDQNIYKVDPKVKRQFNVGAGTPGAQTFHDIAWWQANQEPNARHPDGPFFVNGAGSNYAFRDAAAIGAGARDALPVHAFSPDIASTTYLRESTKLAWTSQN